MENREIESPQVTVRVTNKCIWQINRELRTNLSIREPTNWQVHKHIIIVTAKFYISFMMFSPLKGNLVMKGFSLNTDRLIMSECLQNSFSVVTLSHEKKFKITFNDSYACYLERNTINLISLQPVMPSLALFLHLTD